MPDFTTLARVLRDAGLEVVEIDGWQRRGRPGSFNPVGVLWHHTGGSADGKAYAEWLAKVGRSDLPAPLCQLAVGRDGTWYVCAAGRANHAGRARASGSVAAGDGNSLYVGVECMNTGSEGWTRVQYDAMVTGGAALAGLLGTSVRTHRAHRETSVTGKWDPGRLDMDKFRRDINAQIEGDDMPSAEEVAKAVLNAPVGVRVGEGNDKDEWPLHRVLRHLEQEQDNIKRKLDRIIAALEGEGEEPAPKA